MWLKKIWTKKIKMTKSPKPEEISWWVVMDEKRTTVIEHLKEMRHRIIISVLALAAGSFCAGFFFWRIIRTIVFGPLESLGVDPVLIGVSEGFFVQLKLAILGGAVLAGPLILWQVMSFIIPAFYAHERKILWFSFFSALLLFAGGIIFGYFIVLGPGLRVLLINFTRDFTLMLSVERYVSFFGWFLLPFGLIFQMPLAAFLAARTGILNADSFRKKRKQVILAVFAAAALLSPGGDILTQVLFAIPMVLLYELSIMIVALTFGKKTKYLAKSHENKGE